MAKIISYKFLSAEINRGTEENPIIEQVLQDAKIECKNQADYDAKHKIAEKEAIPGTIEITGEFNSDESNITPTLEERVGTVEGEVADLSEALDMIINEVTE